MSEFEENFDNVESVNADETGRWSRLRWWIGIEAIDPNYVLVKKGFFSRKITAVACDRDIPSGQKLDPRNPNSYISKYQIKINPNEELGYEGQQFILSEVGASDLLKLKEYYEQTSRDLEVDRVVLEIRYRNYLYTKASSEAEYNEFIKSRKFIDSPELLEYLGIAKNPQQLELIADANYAFYRRKYGNVIVNIPKKQAKEGFKIRLPFQQTMKESLIPIQLSTARNEIGIGRKISYDIDPKIAICDPATFVKLLQGDIYSFDRTKIFNDILVQVNKLYYNYFSTRIDHVKDVKKLQEKSKKDKDLLWDLAKIGMSFGIEFVDVGCKVYDSEQILAANDEKKGIEIRRQAELESIRQYKEEGIDPTIAFVKATGGSTGGGQMSINDILGIGLAKQMINNPNGGLFGGQPTSQQQPTRVNPVATASGLPIEYLYRQGICDENGNLDFDVINEILVERGLAEGSQILGAEDLTRDEAFKIFNKVKGRRM